MFGLTMSDLTALLNLTNKIQKISETSLTYTGAKKETEERLSTIGSRTSTKDLIENLYTNIFAGIGESLSSSMLTYIPWLISDTLVNAGDIQIPVPFVGQIGVGQTMRTALLGITGIANLVSSLVSLSGGGPLNLNN